MDAGGTTGCMAVPNTFAHCLTGSAAVIAFSFSRAFPGRAFEAEGTDATTALANAAKTNSRLLIVMIDFSCRSYVSLPNKD
jgi:hypothetical protein